MQSAQNSRVRLPDFGEYRKELTGSAAPPSLPEVPSAPGGLLASLPKPAAGRTGWPWNVETARSAYEGREWPKISIIMPSYQQGLYVEETIRSVLLQNYPRLEFVILDGGSRDGTIEVLAAYRPWVSFLQTGRDRGQSHAINRGLALATGRIVGWINSDDFYLPGALARVARKWLEGYEFIYGDALNLSEVKGKMFYAASSFAHGRYVKFPGLVPSHAAFWSHSRTQALWEEQHCALDYELWIRLVPGLRVGYINWPLAVARQHEAAKSFNPAMAKQWEDDARRNGEAHPELYRSRPWLDREHRLVQRVTRRWRARHARAQLEALRLECGWENAPLLESA